MIFWESGQPVSDTFKYLSTNAENMKKCKMSEKLEKNE